MSSFYTISMIRPTINYFLSILSQLADADNNDLLRPLERQYNIIINITINALHKKKKNNNKCAAYAYNIIIL